MNTRLFFIGFFICSLLYIDAIPAKAEPFIDLYLGEAITQDSDVSVQLFTTTPATKTSEKVDFDPSFTVGMRAGHWFETVPYLGIAADFSYFKPESDKVKITTVALSPLLMLRYPLLIEHDFPKGKFQPYLGIGPGLFYSDVSADFRPILPNKVSGLSLETGLDTRAGVAWLFNKHIAVFGEYRYTHYDIDIKNETAEWLFGLPTHVKETIETTIETNHLLMGMSVRF